MKLQGKNITVTIGSRTILDDVSLDVETGEMVAVLGPNGAGKSTLLKVLSGDWKPAHGEVLMNGRPLGSFPLAERGRRRAVLPQQSLLSFAFTALDVVLMGRIPHARGGFTGSDHEIARAALAEADAAHLASHIYTTLSGGERQRIHLARVLAQIWDAPLDEGCYLLFDEPLTGLDLAHQHKSLATTQRFAARGTGVLTILHDLNLAAQYADRILVLHHGRIVANGAPKDVLRPELIRDVFALDALVLPHPHHDSPLIVAGAAGVGSR